VRQQLERLEHEADALRAQPGPAVLVVHEQVGAEQPDLSPRRHVEPRQQAEQRRLAGTGGTDDRNRFAARDFEVDIIQNRQAAGRVLHDLGEPFGLERRRRRIVGALSRFHLLC